MTHILPDALADPDSTGLEWQYIEGSNRFDYPIKYWIADVSAAREAGRIDFLTKWVPDSYCHFHRHLGRTASRALEGEDHMVDTSETEMVHKILRVGDQAQSSAGDLHMAYAGPDGAVVFFRMETSDGRLFEIIAPDGAVLAFATVDDFISKRPGNR